VITGDDRVAACIAAAVATRRPALEAIRDLCRTHLTGFTETLRYGMPGYVRDVAAAVGFPDQKRYISLHILRTDVLDAHRAALTGLRGAWGTGARISSMRRWCGTCS
jgi:uncharacterized protein YdhG (YjbR/CyaY superfamily)